MAWFILLPVGLVGRRIRNRDEHEEEKKSNEKFCFGHFFWSLLSVNEEESKRKFREDGLCSDL